LSVVDEWNGRTMFYDTATGQPLSYRLEGNSVPTPDVNPSPSTTTGATDNLVSMGREYQVDYGTTDGTGGHPWKLAANWFPPDNQNFELNPQGVALRWLSNGQEYAYVFVGAYCSYQSYFNTAAKCDKSPPGPMPWGGILIYRLNTDGPGSGMKQVAEVLRDSPEGGPLSLDEVKGNRLEFISDSNGDGVLGDSGDADDATAYDGYFPGNPGTWVDGNGTIWFAGATTLDPNTGKVTEGVANVPLHGFDGNGDPLYQASDMSVKIPLEGDWINNAYKTPGTQVKYDSTNNRVYTEVDSGEFPQFANGGGNAVMMTDLATGQQSLFSGYSRLDGPRDIRSMKRATGAVSASTTDTVPVASEP
jgi:hypothetical protein